MSLKLWLPLNGDFHNQGLSGPLNFTTTGTITDQPGKIGQSKQFSSSNVIAPYNFTLGIEISACCWIYYTAFPSSSSNDWILDLASSSGYSSTPFGLSTYHSTLLVPIVGGKYDDTYTHNFSLNTWYHIAFTWNSTEGKLYINGELKKTYTTLNGGTVKTGNKFSLGSNVANSSTKFKGRLNDVRIYDHCLSAKEVEEISKGLILHYKLDNNGFGNENYWGNGKPLRDGSGSGELRTMFSRTNSAYASVPTFIPNQYIETKFLSTRTPVEDGGIQLQKLQRYSETVNSMCPILEHLKTGEQFTISYELYVTSPVNIRFHLNKVLDGTSTKVQPDINLIQISTLNAWTKVSQSIEIPSSYDESNITTESRLGMYISIREILGTTSSGEVTIRIRNIKFEKGQVATAWTPARADFGHSNDDIIYDSSGYGNNGNIINGLSSIDSLPRYDKAAHFSATNQKIKISNLSTTGFTNSYSFAWWEKISSVTPMHWGFADGVRLNGMYTGRLWNTGDGSNNPLYNPGTTTQVTTPTANVWHHWVMTGNGTKCLVYQDGELWGEAKTYKSITGTTIYINGWAEATNYSSDNASMSDFRIYSTALTAEQVKELYNTSATIDKNGNIYTRELVEI